MDVDQRADGPRVVNGDDDEEWGSMSEEDEDRRSAMSEGAAVDCSDGVSAQRVRPSSSVSNVEKQLRRAMALHSNAWHTQPQWWQR